MIPDGSWPPFGMPPVSEISGCGFLAIRVPSFGLASSLRAQPAPLAKNTVRAYTQRMPEPKSEASRILGVRLRHRRRQLSLNQEAVAHLAGLNVSNYARIDRGTGNPTFHTLIRLASVLGMEPGDLVTGFNADHLPPSGNGVPATDVAAGRLG
ncbi:XRE family transcriptional regulator [Cryobacterium cryoconiti]|uniref:XRE family transcriptional regulator n=2 Tax=Cryobacterium cryoconiti TaxID=1259239 RepID=A0A4Y8JTQ9_9MICO|nr:XRE family transcriptional regulator [Cryobacterium cryoconiti]